MYTRMNTITTIAAMEGRKPLHPVQVPTSAKLVQHNKKRAHVHKKESVRFNLDPLM